MIPESLVASVWDLPEASLIPIPGGHINTTWRVVQEHFQGVLQRLNPIFGPEVHLDIEAVTRHLTAHGVATPHLVVTAHGTLWHEDRGGEIWRMFDWVPGVTIQEASSARQCAAAGHLLGQFHRALWSFQQPFAHTRPGVHDTKRHLDTLESYLTTWRHHPRFDQIEPVAEMILKALDTFDLNLTTPKRVVHGDPKISNIIFRPDGDGLCLVDLDTLARMPIAVELGDAFRSWCAPGGENREAEFDVEWFEAGLTGWNQSLNHPLEPCEIESIAPTVELISLELAARFCADALAECYFGWDTDNYPTASHHNLARSRSQLALAQSVHRQLGVMERTVVKVIREPIPTLVRYANGSTEGTR